MVNTRPFVSSRSASARRLLSGAQRPLGDLAAVMASPPTITNPVSDGANSTVQTGQAYNAGMFSCSDATRVTPLGGPLQLMTANSGYRIQTTTRAPGARVQGHSSGIAFYTDAQTVDFAMRCNGNKWIAYVTDPAGVRARIAAADQTQGFSGLNYYKLDFGSTAAGGRLIEIYNSDVGSFGGINVPNGYSIWPAPLAHQPSMLILWDSFGEGSINDATLQLKLGTADYLAAMFGVNNPIVNAVGGTGVIGNNASVSTYNTFQQRVSAGDIDVSRIGAVDLVFAPGSVNDNNVSNSGLAIPAGDATVQAAYQAYIASVMVAQPNAIIVGAPQEMSSSLAAVASRVAAYKAGFVAAAAGDPRMIFLDNTVFEYAPDTGVIGADNVHPGGIFGARHIGSRIGTQSITALRAQA